MKSWLLISILFLGSLFDSSAMVTASRDVTDDVQFFSVRVFTCPVVEVIKLPEERGILIDGNLVQNINAERGIKYRGISLKDDLFLTCDMPDSEFYSRIYYAFDKVACVRMKVSMPKELFATVFPSLDEEY